MEKINDMNIYNKRMAAGMADKLFFLNEVRDIDTIVDFGCANGELLRLMPDTINKIGVDNNPDMISAAKKNCPEAKYVSSLNDVHFNGTTLLNLSSVIHEVYSYLPEEEINAFWDSIFNSGYNYIAIRDMMVSNITNRPWDEDGANKAAKHPLFADFHASFPLTRERDLIHFLLKYRYVENWDRESKENYFPITLEELKALIPENYEIVYENHYALEWTKNKAYEDIGYEIKDNTHIKLILKLK
jgi:SAM-dependent methyltransferase